MKEKIIKYTLKKEIQAIKYLIRNDCNELKLGENLEIENALFYIANEFVFGIDTVKKIDFDCDINLKNKLLKKISYDTKQKIKNLTSRFAIVNNAFRLDEREYKKNIKYINLKIILSSCRNARKLYKIYDKEYNINNITRIEINYSIFPKIFSFVSILILLTGIFRAILLGKKFGFSIDFTYTLSDYISASLSIISFHFSAIIIGIILILFISIEDTKLSDKNKISEGYKSSKQFNFFTFILIILALIFGFIEKNIFNFFTQCAIFFLLTKLLILLIPRYFKNGQILFISILYTIYLFVNVYFSTMDYYDKILNKESSEIYYLELSSNIIYQEVYIISKTGDYLIFWDCNKSETIIMNKSNINIIQKK